MKTKVFFESLKKLFDSREEKVGAIKSSKLISDFIVVVMEFKNVKAKVVNLLEIKKTEIALKMTREKFLNSLYSQDVIFIWSNFK